MKKLIGVIISVIGALATIIAMTYINVTVWTVAYVTIFMPFSGIYWAEVGHDMLLALLVFISGFEIYVNGCLIADIRPMKTLLNKYSRKMS